VVLRLICFCSVFEGGEEGVWVWRVVKGRSISFFFYTYLFFDELLPALQCWKESTANSWPREEEERKVLLARGQLR